jgi:hypothetical protein
METSPIFLFGILILLAGTTAADSDDSDKKCDPEKDQCSDKSFQYCQDHDGNGKWTCACEPGYSRDMDGHCVLSACSYEEHPNGEYRTVDGKCFYYQKSDMEYVDAVANCKSKFNGNGRLFEPKSKKINEWVVGLARAISANQPFWIGIRTQPHDESRDFYYLSEGPSVALAYDGWLDGEPNDVGNKEDCVSVLRFGNDLRWDDSNCDNTEYSICELDEKEGCGSPEWSTDNFCDDQNNKAGCNSDGGACCHNSLDIWDKHCEDCECIDPNARLPPVCLDAEPEKQCKKKCKGNKCKKSGWCKKNCQKTCDNCPDW